MGKLKLALCCSLIPSELASYVTSQMEGFFPDGRLDSAALSQSIGQALERLELCFSRNRQRYYASGKNTLFNHLNTDQYAAFLYLLGNTIHREDGDPALAAKAYALNKALHALDIYYEVNLPEVFAFVHPVGTVIGRATFGDCFCIYQNCTVGGDLDGNLPVLGTGVVMFGGSRVIGRANVGDNCMISAGSIVVEEPVPANSLVFGTSPNLTIKPSGRNVVATMFGDTTD